MGNGSTYCAVLKERGDWVIVKFHSSRAQSQCLSLETMQCAILTRKEREIAYFWESLSQVEGFFIVSGNYVVFGGKESLVVVQL